MSIARTAIIALDINRKDPKHAVFLSLSAEEKIKLLRERINYICTELKTKEPHSMWIVIWREYGITDGKNRAITPQAKSLFKQTMQNLIKKFHPNLTIIAGTISTKKQVNDAAKLNAISKYYAEISWIKDMKYFFSKQESTIQTLQQKMPDKGIIVLRNTCYLFHQQDIWRHDKIAPIGEEDFNSDLKSKVTVFQPGNKKSNIPDCELIHPFSKSSIKIGVEICLEHFYATLKKTSPTKPMLHFILSDSISLNLDEVNGDYVFQADGLDKSRLILTKNEDYQNLPICFYQSNMLERNHHLSGPLQPLYPFKNRIIDKMQELISQSPTEVKEITEKFCVSLQKLTSNLSLHDELKKWLQQNQDVFLNAFKVSKDTLFKQNFSIVKWLEEVNTIMDNDPDKNSNHMDYRAITDSPSFN